MCARFSQISPPDQIERLLDVPIPSGLTQRFNIAPTQDVLVVTQPTDQRQACFMSWGLIPPWSKDGQRYVNARSETIFDKPAFRNCFLRRRCLIPATSFFEWKAVDLQPTFDLFEPAATVKGAKKIPYAFGLNDEEVFCMAGVWDTWRKPDGELQNTFTILTTEPNELIAPMHDRMPVIIHAEDIALWFGNDDESRRALLTPTPAHKMWTHRVSTDVNNPRNEYRELLRPVED